MITKYIDEIEYLDGPFCKIIDIDGFHFWMYVDNEDSHDPYFILTDDSDIFKSTKAAHISMTSLVYYRFKGSSEYHWDEWILNSYELSRLVKCLHHVNYSEDSITVWQILLFRWDFESHATFFSSNVKLDEEYSKYSHPLVAFVHDYFDRFMNIEPPAFYKKDTPIPDYTQL